MDKPLKGLSRKESVQNKVDDIDCITNIVKGFTNDIIYNIDASILVEDTQLVIDLKSKSGEIRLDIARSYDVSKDKFLPSLCKISKVIKLKIFDDSGKWREETIDFSNLERAIIGLDEEKIEKIKHIKLIFAKTSMEGMFLRFIYNKINLDSVRSSLEFNFRHALNTKTIRIKVKDNKSNYDIQASAKVTAKSIVSKTRSDGTIIEIKKNREKSRRINIFVNDVLYNFDSDDRYVNWRRKPFRKDGYTFVDLIIDIKFYIDDFNLNDIEGDKNLFLKVKKEVEDLLEANKKAFENPNVNINYEEDKKLLNYIMPRIGYTKYSNGVRDVVRAIKKAEDDGHKIIDILKLYL